MTQATIRIQFPNRSVSERGLPIGTYTIGREAGDIVLGDPNVSSRHAQLSVDAAGVSIRDVGSTNGTFDATGKRLSTPLRLAPNQWVRLGECIIMVVSVAPATGGTALMPQVPSRMGHADPAPAPQLAYAAPAPQPAYAAPVPQPAYAAAGMPPAAVHMSPSAGPVAAMQNAAKGMLAGAIAAFGPSNGGDASVSSTYSHPDQPVRHSYPVVQQGFGVGAAMGLLMKTSPFILARLGVLCTVSLVSLVVWIIAVGGLILLGKASPLFGWIWFVAVLGGSGWIWRTVVRYFLHLLKAAHIAVLTEVITHGRVGNGTENMFAYGKRIVTERFGEVNMLFAIDLLVDGIVGAFNRTLDWVSNLIPIPGLGSVIGFVKAVLRASTTYIDETVFSYNLARGDANVYRSSKDGIIYYAQNSKEILKTGVVVVILERVLSFVAFWLIFLPIAALVYLLPATFGGWLPITALVAGLLFASNVRQAFLKPLFLTMLMLRFHSIVRGQAIDLVWDQRLDAVTAKFRQLKEQASAWVAGQPAVQPVAHVAPAE
jgi:hypothetical protein